MRNTLLIMLVGLFFFSCHKKSESPVSQPKSKPASFNIQFVFETSGSMRGYFESGEFQKQISNLIGIIDKIYQNPSQEYDIKSLCYYSTDNSSNKVLMSNSTKEVLTKLLMNSLPKGKNSILDQLIENLFVHAKSDTVIFLVTDLILDNKNIKALPTLEARFMNIFAGAVSSDVNLSVFKHYTFYNSLYYPPYGQSKLIKCMRPYYVLVLGKSNNVRHIIEILKQNDLISKSEDVVFGNSENNIKWNVSHQLLKTGKWRFEENGKRISKAKLKDGILSFLVGLDLYSFPNYAKDHDYLKNNLVLNSDAINIKNIEVLPKSRVESEAKGIKNLTRHDREVIRNSTHFLRITIDRLDNGINKLNIKLKELLPDWIKNSSTQEGKIFVPDDSLKTFGLYEILNGINKAYEKKPNSNFLFNFNIEVES